MLFLTAKALVYRTRTNLLEFAIALLATLTYAFAFRYSGALPTHELFFRQVYFNPLEPIIHTIVWVPLLIYSRDKELWIFFAIAFSLSSFFHEFPYFYVFLLDFLIVLLIADSFDRASPKVIKLFSPIVYVMVVLFILYAGLIKFSIYLPVDMHQFQPALAWASRETPDESVLLVAPPKAANREIELLPIQQIRTLYYSTPHHVEAVGLDQKGKRLKTALAVYSGGPIPSEADFVFYGPFERGRFPDFPGVGRKIYQDSYCSIFDVRIVQRDLQTISTSD
jgi:hypothetical protein